MWKKPKAYSATTSSQVATNYFHSKLGIFFIQKAISDDKEMYSSQMKDPTYYDLGRAQISSFSIARPHYFKCPCLYSLGHKPSSKY